MNTDNYRAGVPYRAELARTDPAAAALFYEAMFGWHLPASGTGVCEIGGVAVSAIETAATDQSSRWTTYVYAEDVEAAHDQGIAAGGTQFEAPRASASGRQVAKVADPSGAVIGLFEPGASCAALVNEPGALTGGELITDDAQASAELQRDAFGWELSEPAGPSIDGSGASMAGADPRKRAVLPH